MKWSFLRDRPFEGPSASTLQAAVWPNSLRPHIPTPRDGNILIPSPWVVMAIRASSVSSLQCFLPGTEVCMHQQRPRLHMAWVLETCPPHSIAPQDLVAQGCAGGWRVNHWSDRWWLLDSPGSSFKVYWITLKPPAQGCLSGIESEGFMWD